MQPLASKLYKWTCTNSKTVINSAVKSHNTTLVQTWKSGPRFESGFGSFLHCIHWIRFGFTLQIRERIKNFCLYWVFLHNSINTIHYGLSFGPQVQTVHWLHNCYSGSDNEVPKKAHLDLIIHPFWLRE